MLGQRLKKLTQVVNKMNILLLNTHLKFHSKVGYGYIPSLVVFWALQMIRDPRPFWIIGATEEEEDVDDAMERAAVLSALHDGKLSFSLEEKGRKWACNMHPLVVAEMVLTWTMPSIAIFSSLFLFVC